MIMLMLCNNNTGAETQLAVLTLLEGPFGRGALPGTASANEREQLLLRISRTVGGLPRPPEAAQRRGPSRQISHPVGFRQPTIAARAFKALGGLTLNHPPAGGEDCPKWAPP